MVEGSTLASAMTRPADDAPMIEVRGLWSVFPVPGGGEVVVHKDLDLTVRRGEILTLVGGSGTGKTVLLRQMLGLNRPARGSITVLGRPVGELTDAGAAARVGMLFQQGALFSAFSVLDNIALPLRETRAIPDALAREAALLKLQMVGLKPGDAHKMPAELSGGMIKRAALARALALDPDVVFLDEPTAGLDPIGAAEFDRLTLKLRDTLGLTVFMVTHDLDSLVEITDRIAVLGNRKVLVDGTFAELKKVDHPWVNAYFNGPRAEHLILR